MARRALFTGCCPVAVIWCGVSIVACGGDLGGRRRNAGGRDWGGLVLGGMSLLLTMSVVYCQMPYGVDAIAGLAVAGVAIAVALWLYPREGRTARDS